MRKPVLALLCAVTIFVTTSRPIVVRAIDEEPADYGEETITPPIQSADAVFTEFEVLRDNGYTINMYHAYQGPLCDAAFLHAQGNHMLVTDYFNVSVNNNLRIYEIASDVQLRVKIPEDLVERKRTWWMICISRNGNPYIFEDEDEDDKTITFTANRFYAYAMCYTDEPREKKRVEEVVEEVDENARSKMHSILDSQTIGGEAKINLSEINVSNTEPVVFYGTKTNRMPRLRSNMEDALRRQKNAEDTTVYYFTL